MSAKNYAISVPSMNDGIISLRWRTYSGISRTPVRVSFGGMTRRQTMVLLVETAEGLTGYGETWVNYPAWAIHERAGALREGLAPAILGKGTLDREALMEMARRAVMPYARQAGAIGPAYSLLCGLEMALFDLEAKRRSVPFYRLFSDGADRAPIYASGLDTNSDRNRVSDVLAASHRRIKFKCGFDFEHDISALREIRARIGPSVEMLIDANQAYTAQEALRFAEACAPLGLTWFEEPMNCNDLDGMAWLRDRCPIPIAAGENWYGLDGLLRGVDAGAVDIVQPDIIKNATISEVLELGRLLKSTSTRIAFHNFSSTFAVLASVHLSAGVLDSAWVETDVTGSPLTDGFLQTPLDIADGWCVPPSVPGIGAEIVMPHSNEEEVTR